MDPVSGANPLRCEVARRVCRASFSSSLVSALRASESSSFARRRRFFARRTASFTSFRFCLAARDSSFAVCTESSAVVSRARARANSTAAPILSEGCDIFMPEHFYAKRTSVDTTLGLLKLRLRFRGHRARRSKRPTRDRAPKVTAISAPRGLPLRSQLRQRVRKARPFEQLLSAPSTAHSDLFTRQPRYLSCMSTPPPVALTATPCWVEEMRTITPA